MLAAKGFQSFTRRTDTAPLYILKPLANPLSGIGPRGDVKEALVGLGVLYDDFRLPVYSQNDRPPAFLKTFQELSRIAPKCCHGLNVFGDVEHDSHFLVTPLKVS
jgi:hypothetical protein